MSSTFPDVVVVLPGIIGSVLSKDGKTLWAPTAGAVWRMLVGDGLHALRLNASDDGQMDLEDGVTATGLMPNAEVIPGFWKHGGYSILSKDLVNSLRLEPGENFFEFPYDWRRDNRVAARLLARRSHNWLKRWKEKSGNADPKLILVAHSMGGLVARHFIECQEGWRSVRLLLSFGTPYRGSGRALNLLSNGLEKTVGPVAVFDGTATLRSFDSVYQLLPTYPFVEDKEGKLSRTSDLSIPNVDGSRTAAGYLFHEEIRKAACLHKDLVEYREHGPKLRPVIGIEQPTFQSAKIVAGKIEMSNTHEGAEYHGDGTVSRVSAIPIGADEGTATYAATSHSALNSLSGTLAHLRGVLTGSLIDLDKFRRDTREAGTISLHLADAFVAPAPVTIAATTSTYVQSLDAVVERLDGPAEVRKPVLSLSQGVYRSEIPLPAGLYRVTVARNNFEPVSDVFLVADTNPIT